jgi:TolB protein
MRYLLGTVVFCVALGAALPADVQKEAKLVYPSNRTGDVNLFLINPDGSAPKNLTDSRARDTFPAWSPDGKKIAFTSDRNGNRDIYVMDADGGYVKQLTRAKVDSREPAWSPDGKKIAFCRHLDNNPDIFVMDADGSNPTNLTNNPAYDGDPAWSPDGKKIAFASDRGGQGFRPYVMDASGANIKELSSVPNRLGFTYPAWSPDGKRIIFSEPANKALEVFLCDADGSNKKQLTKLGDRNSMSAWSPDGKKIAFNHMAGGDNDGSLYLMDADGGNPTEILKAEGPIEGGRPAWKPK